jgi:SAM-dependent methyltransferase
MEPRQASAYGDSFADVYDDWYGDLPLTDECADRVAALAAGRHVLELGVGTGRLALALKSRGVTPVGLDASQAMLERLRDKPAGQEVRSVVADMATPPFAPESFGLVLVAFNTFFNLPDELAQRRCLTNVRRLVQPGGLLIIETIVFPDTDHAVRGVDAPIIDHDRVVLTASRLDPASRSVNGQHVEITEQGIRLRPWHLHYLLPAELDALAAEAGWQLEGRSEGWTDQPFTESSEHQVVTFRRASAA